MSSKRETRRPSCRRRVRVVWGEAGRSEDSKSSPIPAKHEVPPKKIASADSKPDAPSTDLWVERCRSGDPVAWRHLYDEHFPMVFRLAIRLGASEREAADISQEVFLRAWKGLHTFRGEAQFRTWLYRITFNETSRFAKKSGLRRKLSAVL